MGRKVHSKGKRGSNAFVKDVSQLGKILAEFFPGLPFDQLVKLPEVKAYRLKKSRERTIWLRVYERLFTYTTPKLIEDLVRSCHDSFFGNLQLVRQAYEDTQTLQDFNDAPDNAENNNPNVPNNNENNEDVIVDNDRDNGDNNDENIVGDEDDNDHPNEETANQDDKNADGEDKNNDQNVEINKEINEDAKVARKTQDTGRHPTASTSTEPSKLRDPQYCKITELNSAVIAESRSGNESYCLKGKLDKNIPVISPAYVMNESGHIKQQPSTSTLKEELPVFFYISDFDHEEEISSRNEMRDFIINDLLKEDQQTRSDRTSECIEEPSKSFLPDLSKVEIDEGSLNDSIEYFQNNFLESGPPESDSHEIDEKSVVNDDRVAESPLDEDNKKIMNNDGKSAPLLKIEIKSTDGKDMMNELSGLQDKILIEKKLTYGTDQPEESSLNPDSGTAAMENSINDSITKNPLNLSYDVFENDAEGRFFHPHLSYPTEFPRNTKHIADITLTDSHLNTLMPHKHIAPQIIDTFYSALEVVARRNNLQMRSFPSEITKCLAENEVTDEFINWHQDMRVKGFDGWLLPFQHQNGQWALLVLFFKQCLIIYLDCTNGPLPANLIVNVCDYFRCFREAREAFETWTKWRLHTPCIPKEEGAETWEDNHDSGVEMCLWGYKLVSHSNGSIRERILGRARKGIARFLLELPEGFCDVTECYSRKRRKTLPSLGADASKHVMNMMIQKKNFPPLNCESMDEFCSVISEAVTMQRET